MNKETLEHLSSLMDGELSRETGLFLMRRLSSDAELRQAWRRYHLIRDCLRQQGGRAPLVDVSKQVRLALTEEIAEVAPERVQRRWLKPIAGLAVAATVAFVAILAVGPGGQGGPVPASETAVAQPFTSPNPISVSPATQAASFNPEDQARSARMNAYLLRHNQLAGAAGRQGFVSFVPIISATASDAAQQSEESDTEESSQEAASSTP